MQHLTRRGLSAGLLAFAPVPTLALAAGRGGGQRLNDFAALWSKLPLPFTPAEAFGLLDVATQTEIGAAAIGKALAEYIEGDAHAEADRFLDENLRQEASTVSTVLLNTIDDRLWRLFPELYGPDSDHPAWALNGGFAR